MDHQIIDKNGFTIRRLNENDEHAVQSLCECCADFTQLIEGRAPQQDDGHGILFDLPPDKTMDDKFVFGAFHRDGTLRAVIDLIKDYKTQGEWTIGLMMIDPSERGKGLGSELHSFIKAWALQRGGSTLRIAVMQANQAGHAFWGRMGYSEVSSFNGVYGNKTHTVIVMAQPLCV